MTPVSVFPFLCPHFLHHVLLFPRDTKQAWTQGFSFFLFRVVLDIYKVWEEKDEDFVAPSWEQEFFYSMTYSKL